MTAMTGALLNTSVNGSPVSESVLNAAVVLQRVLPGTSHLLVSGSCRYF